MAGGRLTLSPVDPPYGGVEYQLWQKKSEKSPDAQNFKLELSEHAQRAALFIHHSYNGDIIGLLRENIILNSTVDRVAERLTAVGFLGLLGDFELSDKDEEDSQVTFYSGTTIVDLEEMQTLGETVSTQAPGSTG